MRRLRPVRLLSLLLLLGIGGYGLVRWVTHDWRMFLPGRTTDAHYQLELACHLCHTPYAGVKQEACLGCHTQRTSGTSDAHPTDKFPAPNDPRALDPTRCVSCHREHVPDLTRNVAVTQPVGFCMDCHAGIGKERESHRQFPPTSCASCHNYHDNTSLREADLVAHRGEPSILVRPVVAVRDRGASPRKPASGTLFQQWEGSPHARAAVTCPKCHEVRSASSSAPEWKDRPGPAGCLGCHENEVRTHLGGRHGMRQAHGLPPVSGAIARLPMKAAAEDRPVTCAACHAAHAFDVRPAPVEACLSCHDDQHSRAYVGSRHHALWQAELAGQKPPGSGVSCATCHLARVTQGKRVVSNHNVNEYLRPASKMLRSVCLNCHGLGFAMDALADRTLARTNFRGRPSRPVGSIDMVSGPERREPKGPAATR